MRLLLVHQPVGAAALPRGATCWRTCLREVAFVEDGETLDGDWPVVADADAYALLVEIVSGLRSPLLGETEVQAQFKAFLTSLDLPRDAAILRLGQRVLADAKRVRHRHLQGLATRSYGSLVAHQIPSGRRVVLIGTGALADEILATLGDRHHIHQWGRRVGSGSRRIFDLTAASRVESPDPSTLVVAAPVSAEVVAAVRWCYPAIQEVIDLRAVDQRTPVPGVRVVTLDALFAGARSSTSPLRALRAAQSEIWRLSQAYFLREELRPFGWDDLCA